MTPTSSYTSSGTGRRSQEFTPTSALRGFLSHSGRRAADLSPGYERVWEHIAQITDAGRGLQQELVMTSVEAYPARVIPRRPSASARSTMAVWSSSKEAATALSTGRVGRAG